MAVYHFPPPPKKKKKKIPEISDGNGKTYWGFPNGKIPEKMGFLERLSKIHKLKMCVPCAPCYYSQAFWLGSVTMEMAHAHHMEISIQGFDVSLYDNC